MDKFLHEKELIEYAKPYLKAKGFKKKNKLWSKPSPMQYILANF